MIEDMRIKGIQKLIKDIPAPVVKSDERSVGVGEMYEDGKETPLEKILDQ